MFGKPAQPRDRDGSLNAIMFGGGEQPAGPTFTQQGNTQSAAVGAHHGLLATQRALVQACTLCPAWGGYRGRGAGGAVRRPGLCRTEGSLRC